MESGIVDGESPVPGGVIEESGPLMRWVTYESDGADRVGLLDGDTVRGLAAGVSLVYLLTAGPEAMREAGESATRSPAEVRPLAGTRLRAPIPEPPSLRDGLGFLDHLRTALRGMGMSTDLAPAWTQIPAFYFGNAGSIAGPYDPVEIPTGCKWFDFELEVGAVIGKPGRDIAPEDGESHIAGFTLYCDWSNRNAQFHEMQLAIGQGKSKDMSVTLGPALVTIDELEPYRVDGRLAFDLSASVNGREITKGSLDQMDWSFGDIIAYVSRGVDLRPGDVIGSGTVPGGCLMEHIDTGDPATFTGWLRPGDVVSLASNALGSTRQEVLASTGTFHPLKSGF